MSAMEGGGRGRPPILSIDIVHSIDTVTTSGEAIGEAVGEVVPIHDRRWAMVHAVEATDDRIARMKRLGAGATVTANLMSMAGRPVRPARERWARDADPPGSTT